MQTVTEDKKINIALDIENAIVHLKDMVQRAGEHGKIEIYPDGTAKIVFQDKRSVVDNCIGDLAVKPRKDIVYPWEYTRKFLGTTYMALGYGGEE
jgi:hypothetical protein